MVINMDENIEFLQELYKTSEMGKSSLSELAKILDAKENKIKLEIDQDLEKYENIISKIDKLALKYDKKWIKPVLWAKLEASWEFAWRCLKIIVIPRLLIC